MRIKLFDRHLFDRDALKHLHYSRIEFFQSGGQRLIAAGYKYVYIWEPSSGKLLQKLEGHTAEISTLAMSRTGKYLATGSRDRAARLWDARSGVLLLELKGHTNEVNSVTFSPEGTRLVYSSGEPEIGHFGLAATAALSSRTTRSPG